MFAALRRARPTGGAPSVRGRDEERRFDSTLSQICTQARRMAGFLPTGLGPAGGRAPLVSLFWSLRMDTVEDWRRRDCPTGSAVLALEPRCRRAPRSDPRRRSGADRGVRRRRHGPHLRWPRRLRATPPATSPSSARGPTLIVDAAVRTPSPPRTTSTARCAIFRRHAHVRYYQLASRWRGPFFQSDRTWLAPLRDRLFPTRCACRSCTPRWSGPCAEVKRGLLRRTCRSRCRRRPGAAPARGGRLVRSSRSRRCRGSCSKSLRSPRTLLRRPTEGPELAART